MTGARAESAQLIIWASGYWNFVIELSGYWDGAEEAPVQ
jgi:hypothetical protein